MGSETVIGVLLRPCFRKAGATPRKTASAGNLSYGLRPKRRIAVSNCQRIRPPCQRGKDIGDAVGNLAGEEAAIGASMASPPKVGGKAVHVHARPCGLLRRHH